MFKNWEEVKNTQEGVERILTNSMRMNRVSHSYIFEGPKGTRKKWVATLFAKTLLCTSPKDITLVMNVTIVEESKLDSPESLYF
jgi:DNA polymerase III gamma/tau subunit